MKRERIKTYVILHLLLLLFSMSGICSKKASQVAFLSLDFCLYYTIIIVILGVYAIAWQQIIKRLPLTTAYANRAITIFWGIIWGAVLFKESVTVGKILGCSIVIVGVILYALADGEETEDD